MSGKDIFNDYFASLLNDSETLLQDQVLVLEEAKRQQLQALLSSHTLPKPAPEHTPAPVDLQQTEPPSSKSLTEAPQQTSTPLSLLQWCDNGRPVWAQNDFEALIFDVAGLALAVPLIALGQIQPLNDELTPIFGQAEWFMGLQPTPQGHLRTVNTALFVMPERDNREFLQTAKYVVSIDGLDWGLAVDNVRQPLRIAVDDVTWRSHRSKRPWLAGTVKSATCALLDIPQIGQMLESSDEKRRG